MNGLIVKALALGLATSAISTGVEDCEDPGHDDTSPSPTASASPSEEPTDSPASCEEGGQCPHVEIVSSVAGNGEVGYTPKKTSALEVPLNHPSDVACRGDGSTYFADHDNHIVRRVDRDGLIATVAGTGRPGMGSTGQVAANAPLNYPTGVALNSAGDLFIADTWNHRVVKVDARGVLHVVAGTGLAGHSGDGDLAVEGRLDRPTGIAISPTGEVYIAETGSSVIRMVDTDGLLWTAAGIPYESGWNGDGLPAIETLLGSPWQVTFGVNGRPWIIDTLNRRIRRIKTDGTIVSFIGNGENEWSGDGGLASDAGLAGLTGVAVADDGSVFIGDSANNIIRIVTPDGYIDWYAGSSVEGYNGEGRPRLEADLFNPAGMEFCGTGLIFADSWNHRVRAVESAQSYERAER